MRPSAVYTEDTSARTTLANGTILKWSKTLENIHALNSDTDLTIAYTNWKNETMVQNANRGFHMWQNGCVPGGDLGACQTPTYNYMHATGIRQIEQGQPRLTGLKTHVVLSNGGGLYVWGKNPEFTGNRISSSNGNTRRYLLDMDINKMIFTCTVGAVEKSFFDNVDYVTNPESAPMPPSRNITLKELLNHPEKYYCTGSVSWGNTYVYGNETNDKWRGYSIRPSFLITGDTTAEFIGDAEKIFGTFNANGSFSYDSRNINNHATFGGGGSSPSIYSNMQNGYFMGCKNDIDMTPPDTFDNVGNQAITNALARWGAATNWNHFCYVNGQLFDYGDSVIWCVWGSRAYNSTTDGTSYRDYTFNHHRYIKAEKMVSLLASFGLYFMLENIDPDTENLTPDTLGNSANIVLGEMNADGTTTGRWIRDIDSYSGINKNGKTVNPSYNPTGGGSGKDGDKEKDVDLITQGGNAGFVHFVEINTATTATANQISEALSQFDISTIGKDLLRNLISYKVFACLNTTGGSSRAISIDGHQLELNGTVLRGNYINQGDVKSVDLGTIAIPRTYGDFRDFAPYTKIEMYIPFCGWIDLPSWCMGKTITGTMWVDLANGTCKAVIKASKTPVAEVGGNVSYDIPFIANATGAKTGAVISSALASVASGVGAVTAPNFASVTGAISAGANLASALNANSTTMRGVLGDGSNTNGISKVWIKVTRPKTPDGDIAIPMKYRHVHGLPCGRSMTLSSGDGYTQILDANITGAMTDREKQMIIDGFRHGLIL